MNVKILLKQLIYKISPKMLISLQYQKNFGRPLNWKAPRDINEKINWLKIYGDTSMWSICADKLGVREYVKHKVGGGILVDIYGHWENIEDVEWQCLPNQFVLKTNNGCGDVLICKDKKTLNIADISSKYAKLLKSKFLYQNAESHYSKIKPCIIVEELLDVTKQPIETTSLIDYKIWCFNGKPYYIWACFNRVGCSAEVGCYDLNWNFHPEWSVYTEHYRQPTHILPKPNSFDKMIKIAATLSEGIPQVRVDLYEVDGKPYFGEMTFTSAGGFMDFYTTEFLERMGDQVELPAMRCRRRNKS